MDRYRGGRGGGDGGLEEVGHVHEDDGFELISTLKHTNEIGCENHFSPFFVRDGPDEVGGRIGLFLTDR